MAASEDGRAPPSPDLAPEGGGDDANLVEQLRAGDLGALGELARRHERRALAVATRLLGRRQDAEDLVQEVFLTVLDRIGTFEPGRPFAPWFYRILGNRAASWRKARRVRRAEALTDELASPGETPEAAAERRLLRERIERALADLSDRQRLVVRLFELDGLAGREIAALLEIEETTVRWTLHEARRKLRKALAVTKGEATRG
jgi:RNA polymerase sigma-70 factor (ECF subfamily)